MKIKHKIQLTNFLQGISLMALVLAYILFSSHTRNIAIEQEILTKLYESFLREQVLMDRMVTENLKSNYSRFLETRDETDSYFDQMTEFKYLVNLSNDASSSIESMQTLKMIRENYYGQIDKAVDSMLTGEGAAYAKRDVSIIDILEETIVSDTGMSSIHFNVLNIINQINNSGNILDTYLELVLGNIEVIDAEISQMNRTSQTTLFSFGLVFIVLFFLISMRQALSLSGRIAGIDRNVELLKNGDLQTVFSEKGSDELAVLGKNLNLFQSNLSGSLLYLKEISGENISIQKNLDSHVRETESNTNSMQEQSDGIAERMDNLNESIVTSTVSMEKMNGSVNALNDQVIEQQAMVEESTASVTEMIASIDNVTTITHKKTSVMNELVDLTVSGEEKMEANSDSISRITAQIDMISGIADIINSIADETNLLAMNAAIEAAHAGDAGKGFSVVADEIRKLAEAASENSSIISNTLKEVIQGISEASQSNENASSVFMRISSEIDQFSDSLSEITQTMSELKSGGSQILSAMESLTEVSQVIKENSSQILVTGKEQGTLVNDLKTASGIVTESVLDIQKRIVEINSTLKQVSVCSTDIGESAQSIDKTVSQYNT